MSPSYPGLADNGYMVSAPWRSSGKTLVTIGLAREAYRRNKAIQTFKKGPDYIDPLWLSFASGCSCYNLDPWFQEPDELAETFAGHVTPGTFAMVEGTMGLHDGLETDGTDSNAAVAKSLGLKVILVVDCPGMHRTIAALVNGLQQFDQDVQFAGVILNRLRSSRHASKIRLAIEQHCDIAIVGEVPETDAVFIEEKQLGLTPAPEHNKAHKCVESIADLISENCDVDKLLDAVDEKQPALTSTTSSIPAYKIGIAKDAAFHFYYQDDLDYFSRCGAELVELSPLVDDLPEDLDGLLIGGGFPERYAAQLMSNKSFRLSLHTAIENGLVVHAECAGLMYLCQQLTVDGESFDMVGSLRASVAMQKTPVGRGYALLRKRNDDQTIPAHEFHHSSVVFQQPADCVYTVERGYGIDGKRDGVNHNNAYAGYSHFRHTRSSPWIDDFLAKIEKSNHGKAQVV